MLTRKTGRRHCEGGAESAQEVFGYSDDTDLPFYYYYPNCASFLAASQPKTLMNVCQVRPQQKRNVRSRSACSSLSPVPQSENCVEACDAADTSGDCYSVPDNAPKGAAYGCLRRVKQRN